MTLPQDEPGPNRARYLMLSVLQRARDRQAGLPSLSDAGYLGLLAPDGEPEFPGDEYLERRIRAYLRWNAAVMVHRARLPAVEAQAHLSTYASAATLYEVGFNHFFHGHDAPGGGDQLFFQRHATSGLYARAFLEGRLSTGQLDSFGQEATPAAHHGLPPHPRPRLMPDFWEFPAVPTGLGPINAIHQARFNRYLHRRGIKDTSGQRVWAFLGDGELDDPESLGAVGVAAREELGNLTFVVTCTPQGLDDPVLYFRGAGWTVLTVIPGEPDTFVRKLYAAYRTATEHTGRPTVILAAHQPRTPAVDDFRALRDQLSLEIPDSALDGMTPPYCRPLEDSPEWDYLHERRRALGGWLPARRVGTRALRRSVAVRGSGGEKVATREAFDRLLAELAEDPQLGHRLVPIVPGDSRDSLLAQGGAAAFWTAAGTAYATHGEPMIPLYFSSSMFGFQRSGDQLRAAADQLTRGFLLSQGLRYQDGNSLLLASTNPACVAYDAAYAFELAHLVADALRRMYGEPRPGEDPNVFYYLTLSNEPVAQPDEPADVDVEGILAGMYRYSPAAGDGASQAQILASGIAVPWALEAQRLLRTDHRVEVEIWSVTSWTQLRREAIAVDEWNQSHPGQPARIPYVTRRLSDSPVLAVSAWTRAVPDQIAPFVPGPWASLGTDGVGVDARSIAERVLRQLADRG